MHLGAVQFLNHCVFFWMTDYNFTSRNLCIDGGYDICAEMYNKNILTPLKSFIPKVRLGLCFGNGSSV